MRELVEISRVIGGMPMETLGFAVILAAFGLAAFAIYAVLKIVKAR
jgi:hypothetical protein